MTNVRVGIMDRNGVIGKASARAFTRGRRWPRPNYSIHLNGGLTAFEWPTCFRGHQMLIWHCRGEVRRFSRGDGVCGAPQGLRSQLHRALTGDAAGRGLRHNGRSVDWGSLTNADGRLRRPPATIRCNTALSGCHCVWPRAGAPPCARAGIVEADEKRCEVEYRGFPDARHGVSWTAGADGRGHRNDMERSRRQTGAGEASRPIRCERSHVDAKAAFTAVTRLVATPKPTGPIRRWPLATCVPRLR